MELIHGADTAGVLLIGKGGKWDSVANTSDLPHRPMSCRCCSTRVRAWRRRSMN